MVFPSSDTPVSFSAGGGFSTSSVLQSAGAAGRAGTFEEPGIVEDPLFELDVLGDIVLLPTAAEREAERATSLAASGDIRAPSRTGAADAPLTDVAFDIGEGFGVSLSSNSVLGY